jgi:hypothetical protein
VNRAELVSSMNRTSSELLREKGFISFVDVLIHMGKLTKEDHESWRMRRIPYLERAVRLNLSQLSHLLRTLRQMPSRATFSRGRRLTSPGGRDPNNRSGSANRDTRGSKRPMRLTS